MWLHNGNMTKTVRSCQLSSVCDSETLVRPYQDLHDARTLNNRFFQFTPAARVGVNRAKVSGNSLEEEEVARVQKALEHISMRRIWKRGGVDLYRPGSMGALLTRFPICKTA